MLVKCIRNNSDDLTDNDRQYLSSFMRTDKNKAHLKIGDTFIVYGITFWNSHPWFYVFEDSTDTYPIPRPHHYFEVIDNKFDKSWKLTTEIHEHGGVSCEIVPKEWANDVLFYENLLNDDPQAMALMKVIKARFELR